MSQGPSLPPPPPTIPHNLDPSNEAVQAAFDWHPRPMPLHPTVADYNEVKLAIREAHEQAGLLQEMAHAYRLYVDVLAQNNLNLRQLLAAQHQGAAAATDNPASVASTSRRRKKKKKDAELPPDEKRAIDLSGLPDAIIAPDRYSTEAKRKLGVTAELYKFVPPELYRDMEAVADFRDTFVSALNDNRRNFTHTAKNLAPFIWSGYAANIGVPLVERAHHDYFLSMLKDPDSNKFSKYNPCLFDKLDKRCQFLLVREVALLLRGLLFGPASVITGVRGTSRDPLGDMWGIEEVTPGAIAFAAVMTVYLHGWDTSFAPAGKLTNWQYQKNFDSYKEIIMKNADTEEGAELFDFYNYYVFKKDLSAPDTDEEHEEINVRVASDSSGIGPGLVNATRRLDINDRNAWCATNINGDSVMAAVAGRNPNLYSAADDSDDGSNDGQATSQPRDPDQPFIRPHPRPRPIPPSTVFQPAATASDPPVDVSEPSVGNELPADATQLSDSQISPAEISARDQAEGPLCGHGHIQRGRGGPRARGRGGRGAASTRGRAGRSMVSATAGPPDAVVEHEASGGARRLRRSPRS
ncbi:hypothetical protein NP233_g12522 [Leucocoprinus birnbaumii]|uniref:Uncharacterized protein n=1 Tax=Leucocoprinus birnbaumii TaxID=56174 RepID=A0AAD5YMZ7_9AGAR|nr:hypothetical protein NP233_g12522 [Leucocoprinus birnbaumii]